MGGRGEQEVVDGDGGVEAQVLGAAEIDAHLGERRGTGAEGEARQAESEFHRRPSSFFASSTVRPPTRACGRPPSVTTRTTRISSARGASPRRTSMASKWVRTKAASLKWSGTSMLAPRPPSFLADWMVALPP